MTTNIESAKQYGIKSKYLSSSELKKHFPYLNFSESDEAIYEMDNSGYISPRRLVDAQIQNARQNGCQILFETVNEVKRCVQNGNYIMCVTTDSGRQIFAKKVLLATGAFTSFRNLLPNQLNLDVSLCPVTVAKVQINEAEYQKIR
jgi:glycine/D-amino acid oxidase-like deaminating enzyme